MLRDGAEQCYGRDAGSFRRHNASLLRLSVLQVRASSHDGISFSQPRSSWDTFRTFYPLMALTSPVEFSQIVDSYIDAWRVLGWMPECRANHLPGWTQGGKRQIRSTKQSLMFSPQDRVETLSSVISP